jgi:membrane protease YdiL (CAAX protease family)
MKPFIKAILFLTLLTVLDFLLRKGFIAFFLPFTMPPGITMLILFTLFATMSWFITKWFCRTDGIGLSDLGISLDPSNRFEFLYGFLIGVGLWAIVSMIQSVAAGFSWGLRPDFDLLNLVYGAVFIFIADLGTELFTRGYPLTKFKDSFGSIAAVTIMVVFVSLKSFSFDTQGELLLYTMLIPALHTVFFSIIYFKTKRLGAALGVHTGANFVTISIFDLRIEQPNQAIPSGLFQPNVDLDSVSLTALHMPYVFMAIAFSIVVYVWWMRS